MEGGTNFTWRRVLSAAFIAVVLAIALRLLPLHGTALPWNGVVAAIAVAYVACFVMHRLVGCTWGVLSALAITLSPIGVQAARDQLLPTEGVVLIALAGVLVGWRHIMARNFRPVGWLAVALATSATLAFAWIVQGRSGLTAVLVVFLGLLLGAALGLRLSRSGAACSVTNIVSGFVVAVLAPICGLIAAVLIMGALADSGTAPDAMVLLSKAVEIDPDAFLSAMGEPSKRPLLRWLFLAAILWGVWRALRHGLVLWQSGKLPDSWLLLLFAAVNVALLPQSGANAMLPILTTAILISIFGIGDFFRGIGHSLILRPPHERTE